MFLTRLLAASCCSMLSMAPTAFGQERAPNGRIYGELLPFVGLEGNWIRQSEMRSWWHSGNEVCR